MDEKTLDMIGETLKALADKIHQETGNKMLIGWGICDPKEEVDTSGCSSSDGLEYGDACRLLNGINWFVGDWYGNLPDNSN